MFSSNEEGSTFECSLDRAAWAVCASPLDLTNLAIDDHQLRVRAVDEAGNRDATPATHNWVVQAPVDTVAPETTIDGTPQPVTSDTGAVFGFFADDPNAWFQCQLNRGDWHDCWPGATYSGLAPDDYEFRVRAIDQAGNIDSTPAEYEWSVVPPPDATPPAFDYQPGNVEVESADGAGAPVNFQIPGAFDAVDGAVAVSCDVQPGIYLPIGDTQVTCWAEDSSGNTASVSFWVTVWPPPETQSQSSSGTDEENGSGA
jgi:hypothetical protein